MTKFSFFCLTTFSSFTQRGGSLGIYFIFFDFIHKLLEKPNRLTCSIKVTRGTKQQHKKMLSYVLLLILLPQSACNEINWKMKLREWINWKRDSVLLAERAKLTWSCTITQCVNIAKKQQRQSLRLWVKKLCCFKLMN